MMRAPLRLLVLTVVLSLLATAQTPPMPYKPKFPGDPARSESEAGTLGFMRTVVQAQRDYRKKFGRYAPSLYALAGGGRSFTKRMARTDRGDYTVSFRGGSGGFSLQLTPKQFDPEHRGFYTDAGGVIRVEEEKPATGESPVLKAEQPESEAPKPPDESSTPK